MFVTLYLKLSRPDLQGMSIMKSQLNWPSSLTVSSQGGYLRNNLKRLSNQASFSCRGTGIMLFPFSQLPRHLVSDKKSQIFVLTSRPN
jgi:hypothetical protein